MQKTLLALTITTALLTACRGGGGTTPPPVVTTPPVTTPPVTTPPVTTPPVTTINAPFAFDQHEVTVKAGTSITLNTNIQIQSLSDFKAGTGLNIISPVLPTGERDLHRVQVTAAANAPTYDIYVIGSGLKDSANYTAGSTFDWVKVHVVGAVQAPWVHPEALDAPADPVELAFLKLLNDARAKGGTCTDPATGIPMSWPAVPPVTLNAQASSGLRMKAQDAILRSWGGVHVSPEGMGQSDFINMAGMSGFINEILSYGTRSVVDPMGAAAVILDGFLHSYYHCNTIYASGTDGGGQVAIGYYRSSSNQDELLASFTGTSINSPILKLN